MTRALADCNWRFFLDGPGGDSRAYVCVCVWGGGMNERGVGMRGAWGCGERNRLMFLKLRIRRKKRSRRGSLNCAGSGKRSAWVSHTPLLLADCLLYAALSIRERAAGVWAWVWAWLSLGFRIDGAFRSEKRIGDEGLMTRRGWTIHDFFGCGKYIELRFRTTTARLLYCMYV